MIEYIERDAVIEEIHKAFKSNWEIPCDTRDRTIQETVIKVCSILRNQPALKMTDPKEKPELKPCPFCGELPVISKKSNCIESGCYRIGYAIGCKGCHIEFKAETHLELKDGVPYIVQDGYKECIEKWNRRVKNGD